MRNIDSGKEGFWIDSCAYARPLHDVRQYALNDVREPGVGKPDQKVLLSPLNDVREPGDEEGEGVPHRVYEVWVDVSACGLDESQVRELNDESDLAMIDGDLCYIDALIHVSGNLDEEQLKDRIWQEYAN